MCCFFRFQGLMNNSLTVGEKYITAKGVKDKTFYTNLIHSIDKSIEVISIKNKTYYIDTFIVR